MKLLQLLYSGLGGHGSVAFSIIAADTHKDFKHQALFYGVEDVKSEYLEKCKTEGIEQTFIRKKYSIVSWFRVYRALKTLKPDFLLLHATTATIPCKIYALLHRKKIVVVDHQANEKKRFQDWVFAFINAVLANKYVVLTDHAAQGIRKKIPFLKAKLFTIPNGIDVDFYKPGTPKNGVKIISMIARMNPLRDFATLIEAFDELAATNPDLELHIAGDGPDFEKVKQLRDKAKFAAKIVLRGSLNENEILELLQNTYIYVHSSLADNMSTAVMQAMACGLPLVASDIEALKILISNEKDGLFFKAKNPQDLAEQVQKLIDSNELRVLLGKNARQTAQLHYSHEHLFSRYKKAILSA